jgi:hypothetical protein
LRLQITTVRIFKAEEREALCDELIAAHRKFQSPKLVDVFKKLKTENKVELCNPGEDVITVYEIVE